jgi:hypothetical protein
VAPDRRLQERIRTFVEAGGDVVDDLHPWRLRPGHLGAIVTAATRSDRDAAHYRAQLAALPSSFRQSVEVLKAVP